VIAVFVLCVYRLEEGIDEPLSLFTQAMCGRAFVFSRNPISNFMCLERCANRAINSSIAAER
jgi:hypothetical protein